MTNTGVSRAPSRETYPLKPGHGAYLRKEESVPLGTTFKPGRFGRMFGYLLPLQTTESALAELAAGMVEPNPADRTLNNTTVAAGFTYLGQFVDHDITFDPTPIPEQIVDPQAISNFRTPRLDLDSLYGLGPSVQPYLYDRDNRAKFLIGTNPASQDQNNKTIPELRNDLPRNGQGFALIGDPRNDENLLVAQLHLAFLKFHNAVVDHLEPDPARQGARFEEARRLVTWHYQWIVLKEFLGKVLQPGAVDKVLNGKREYFLFDKEPYMPVEFSVAAYRFGHTMIRNAYDHNRVFGFGQGALAPGTLDLLFHFTGPTKTRPGLPTSAPVPSNWAIDWRRFFDVRRTGGLPFNDSRLLDPLLAPELHDLAKNFKVDAPPINLAERNLIRGLKVSLPSGQDVAGDLEIEPLTPAQLASGSDAAVVKRNGFDTATPLWYYILKEAQVVGKGQRLGPVGSTILAEVFVGMLEGDPTSFLSQRWGWKPTLTSSGSFTMADLLEFADKNSPTINATEDPRVVN